MMPASSALKRISSFFSCATCWITGPSFCWNSACSSFHVVPVRTNTYAAPTQMFAPRPGGASSAHPGGSIPGVRHASSPAPTAIVLPSSLIEVAKPNPSLGSLRDPLMNAC
jgi:hypothetical protein